MRRSCDLWLWLGRWLLAVIVLGTSGTALAGPAMPEGLVPPEVLNEVTVTYPEDLAALATPPSGTVVVKLTVGTNGLPHTLSVEQSVDPEIDALVLSAVSRLRYTPATLNGTPVEVVLRVAIEVQPPPPPVEPTPEETEPEQTGAEPGQPAPEAGTAGPETPPETPAATGPVRIGGRVLEAGRRTPVPRAHILAIPAAPDEKTGLVRYKRYGEPEEPAWQIGAESDDKGRFALRGIPDGKTRIVILVPGYERLEYVEEVSGGQALQVNYFVRRLPDNPYQTSVASNAGEREEVTRRTINVEEITNLPGTQGDALKAIQNFPGIARAPFGIGLLVIRGSDPSDSSVYIGEHEVPQLFHFGGITSTFNSDILTTIDFIPGNFDARYGDAVGGVVDVHTRRGKRDGYHGYVDSDLYDTGVLFEGPLGKGSFIISGRRSYIDILLPALLPKDAGISTTVAPRYYDYQILFDYPVSHGNLSVKSFGSDDRTKLVSANKNDITKDERNQYETVLYFHRVDLLYENHRHGWDILVTPSYRYDKRSAGASNIFKFNLITNTFSFRAEVGRKLSKRIRLDVGTQVYAGTYGINAQAPPIPTNGAGSTNTFLATKDHERFAIPGVYATLGIGLTDKFWFYPSVRLNYYAGLFNWATFDPRSRFIWHVGDKTQIKGGVGIYSQAPDITKWNRTWGNPNLGPEHALHGSLAVGHDFPYKIRLEVTGFAKYLWNRAEPSAQLAQRAGGTIGPEAYASTGNGRIFGVEFFLRKELTRNVFGWISYTISRSQRRQHAGMPWVLFRFDQTHILTIIGVYKLPHNWQIGGRFRLVSGNPYTPIIGSVFEADDGSYIPLQGTINSARVATFERLDLRVDKRFVWKRLMLNIYLDIQNATNHQNQEFLRYSYNYGASQPIPSLPIIPSFGLKLEF